MEKKFFIFNNFKLIGVYYLILSFFGGLIGFGFSVVLRLELNNPFSVLGGYFYYVSLTSHGFIMIFYFLTLLSSGFYNYFLINTNLLKISYKSYKHSWNIFSLIITSWVLVITSLLIGEGVNSGWTLYVPLTSKNFNDSISLDILILGLNVFLLASIFSYTYIISGIITSISNFESFLDIPVLVWSFILTSLLNIFSIPSIFCILNMLLIDRNFNTYYFNPEFGGDLVIFQIGFWIFSHPEVYALLFPIFGLVSQVLKIICGGFLYNKEGIIFSMISVFILSFIVWAHHMVTVGWGVNVKGFFMVCTLVISLPTGVKIFSWLYTLVLYNGRFNLISASLSMFILTFSFGGITGVFLANYSLDIIFHDSFMVVAHMHTIMAASALFGVLSIVFLLFKSVFSLNPYKNNTVFLLFICFIVLLSITITQLLVTLHYLGMVGVPRRIFGFSFNYYLIFHIGSVSFLGLWFSFCFFLGLSLLMVNKNFNTNCSIKNFKLNFICLNISLKGEYEEVGFCSLIINNKNLSINSGKTGIIKWSLFSEKAIEDYRIKIDTLNNVIINQINKFDSTDITKVEVETPKIEAIRKNIFLLIRENLIFNNLYFYNFMKGFKINKSVNRNIILITELEVELKKSVLERREELMWDFMKDDIGSWNLSSKDELRLIKRDGINTKTLKMFIDLNREKSIFYNYECVVKHNYHFEGVKGVYLHFLNLFDKKLKLWETTIGQLNQNTNFPNLILSICDKGFKRFGVSNGFYGFTHNFTRIKSFCKIPNKYIKDSSVFKDSMGKKDFITYYKFKDVFSEINIKDVLNPKELGKDIEMPIKLFEEFDEEGNDFIREEEEFLGTPKKKTPKRVKKILDSLEKNRKNRINLDEDYKDSDEIINYNEEDEDEFY